MAHFFFHLVDDISALDDEGREFPDLGAARKHAERLARFTAGETIKDSGRLNLSHRIDIANEAGQVLAQVTFGDVIDVRRQWERADTIVH